MTYDELFAIGRKRGVVQWVRSRRIEKLRVAQCTAKGWRKGQMVVLVRQLTPGSKEHPIFRPLHEPYDFHCVELDWKTPVPVGDIFR